MRRKEDETEDENKNEIKRRKTCGWIYLADGLQVGNELGGSVSWKPSRK